MEQMLQEKGCDLHCSAANKTPLAQALEIIYRKTKYMVDAIVSHPWVEAQFDDYFFEEGITRVCDAVKIPGIKTPPSKYKLGTTAQQKGERSQKQIQAENTHDCWMEAKNREKIGLK